MKERLLVATRNKLIVWDGRPKTILEKQKYYVYHHFYGITWNEGNIYVSHRLNKENGVIQVFDREFNWVKKLEFDNLHSPHQILWRDGKLYITDAYNSQVIIWGGRKTRYIKVGSDDHPNSVWCDGKMFYVLEHRGARMPKGVQIFDLNFNKLGRADLPGEALVKGGETIHGAHNVYIENGLLYIFGAGALVRYNISRGGHDRIVCHKMMADYYPRGLARTSDRFYIGLSEVKSRGERDKGDSFILVNDNNFKNLDVLRLRDTGALHEIRAIDNVDLAHNSLRCPLLDGKGINYEQEKRWVG
jgi:hypothetical protein